MSALLPAATILFGLLFVLWLVSLRLRDASLVDVFWGLGFVVLAAVSLATTSGAAPRRWLMGTLVVVWGLRLTAHLARRNLGHGEDPRYAAMRARWGRRFGWVSLFTVYLFQGALILVIGLPVLKATSAAEPASLGWLDLAGALVWLVGLSFEALGDLELSRFRADPANRGRVLDSGLWRYTRHPNYFGDFCVWWGLFLVALATPSSLWTIVSPILMSFLLLKVSGVALLEKDIGERRPGYAAYVRRTSAFFPWPPRRE